MTAEERAAQEERRRFVDAVVARAAARAGIENTTEGRRAHIDRVVAAAVARRRARESAERDEPDPTA